MKICIAGTRGIPDSYGGFERFASLISASLVTKGFEMYVYCPHYQNYKEKKWREVRLIYKYCPRFLGHSFSQFVYDLLCILDSRKRNFDVIYHLGYTSSAVFMKLHNKKAVIMTNMDGMEWQRAKYNRLTKKFLLFSEKLAVRRSNYVVADSEVIKGYLDKKYKINSLYLTYPVGKVEIDSSYLPRFLQPEKYFLLISRPEPENNLGLIISSFLFSKTSYPLVVVGNFSNRYGKFLQKKFHDQRIIFAGAIYDHNILNALRHFSLLYFHGHSAGGTNPSLLEAMAAGSLIVAHDNAFNREVLGNNAFYFSSADDIIYLLNSFKSKSDYNSWINANLEKIHREHSLNLMVMKYAEFFNSVRRYSGKR
ncbi:MAG TPA: DUF1972 domain-containing protein [Bacteroidia bacterium]|nr:DUF1972 domain-containing protein [Bacteroidia bacterium]HRS58678.1 DUF1972 domain-containing protein [Bacteroidia bacterium]HRU68301.1 DUF1972 domain-containing protein [Bacteroidia bacterium]